MAGRLAACLLAASLCWAGDAARAEPTAQQLMEDLMWDRGPVGGPFDLTDHSGRRRTDAEFRGRLLILYFGYTHCPDICPADLQAITLAMDALGADGEAVQPLFVTVDPERDTAGHLADYLSSFHPRLIGLTGDLAAIKRVALAYKVFFAKDNIAGADSYAVDHTAFIYLVGRDGRYLGFLPPGTPPERIAAAVRAHLK